MRTMIATAAALATLVMAVDASAQLKHSYLHDNHGPEFGLGIGAGGFVNDSSTAFTNQQRAPDHLYWPGVQLEGTFAGRITPWLSIGGRLNWQYSTPRDLPMGTTGGSFNMLTAGPFVRLYIGSAAHWHVVNPWIGVGIEPTSTIWAQHSTPLGSVLTRVTAVGVPIQGGIEFNVTDVVALGIVGTVSPWTPYEACSSVSPGGNMLCTGQGLAGNTYLSASANMRVQLPW